MKIHYLGSVFTVNFLEGIALVIVLKESGYDNGSIGRIYSEDIVCTKIDIASVTSGKSPVSTVGSCPSIDISEPGSTGNIRESDKEFIITVTVKISKKIA